MKKTALALLILTVYSLNALSIKNEYPEPLYVMVGSHPEIIVIGAYGEKSFSLFAVDSRATIRITTKKVAHNTTLILEPDSENDFTSEQHDGYFHITWTVSPDAHLTVSSLYST